MDVTIQPRFFKIDEFYPNWKREEPPVFENELKLVETINCKNVYLLDNEGNEVFLARISSCGYWQFAAKTIGELSNSMVKPEKLIFTKYAKEKFGI